MCIDIKYIILLYLFNYCIYRFYEILYALINLTKIKTKTKTKTKAKTKKKNESEAKNVKIILISLCFLNLLLSI